MKNIRIGVVKILIKIILVLIVATAFFAEKTYANEISGPDIFEMVDTSQSEEGTSIKEKAENIFKKGIDFSLNDVLKKGADIFFGDVTSQMGDMRKIAALILVCAVLKNISSSFAGKQVSQLSFFVCYIVIIYIVMDSFYTQCTVIKSTVERFAKINAGMIPVFLTISAAQGKIASTALSSSVIMGLSGLISAFICSVFIPVLTAFAGLEMVNNISENNFFSSMCGLIKSLLSFSLKGAGLLFAAVSSLWRLSASGADTLLFKTAKTAVKCVPVVGEILSSSAETIATAASAVGNSFTAAALIVAVGICAAPVLKLAAIFFIYRITSAVTEPVSDKRITKTLESAGDFFLILIGAVFLSAVMFVFSAVILMAVF
ncbi:MAG: stage III sporulation protein AE [Clostridia bacterium]|jgi:stage III sporulation protein AE|nr:stage III sporulation protein AE [Clostridia bacterium]MCI2015725.1 stage III sporulation protein AE [Clostridia bacterium]